MGEEPPDAGVLRWQVKPISKQLKRDWKLAPFYKKHVSIDGFPILASERVSDYALLEAAYLIERMVDKRPDLVRALVQNKTRFVVMGVQELTTQEVYSSGVTYTQSSEVPSREGTIILDCNVLTIFPLPSGVSTWLPTFGREPTMDL